MGAKYTIEWDQVSSLVQDKFVSRIRDNFFLSNALWFRWKSRVEEYEGGRSIVVPLNTGPEGNGGVWWSGTDMMDTRIQNTIQSAQYFRKNAAVPVAVSEEDEDTVRGPTSLMRLISAKMKTANRTIIDQVGTALFNDGGNPKAMTGLQYALVDTITTVSQTFGGITRGGASSIASWWMHQTDTTAYVCGTAAQGGTFCQATRNVPLDRMWAKIGLNSGKSPTVLVANWGCYTDYHASFGGNTQYNRPQMNRTLADYGFENTAYKGRPFIVDERAPRAANVEKLYMLNEDAITLYVHSNRNFNFTGFRIPYNQFARIAYLQFAGELCFDEMRCHGVFSNITTTNVL